MKTIGSYIGVVMVLAFGLTGCQSNRIEEIVNTHGDIENLDGLNAFVDNVENQHKDEINFVQYGIEGQQGVKTLTFDGQQIRVSSSVDGDFVEEYSCQNIKVENDGTASKYILRKCTGNFTGDFELLSIQNK